MPRRAPIWLSLALAAAAAVPAHAQREPRRPRLTADADTNDAEAYFAYGMSQQRDVWKAHDAFCWASRLGPDRPTYLYGRYLALWGGQTSDWRHNYLAGSKFVVNSRDGRRLDSLLVEVMLREPFLYVRLPCPRGRDLQSLARERDRALAAVIYWSLGCDPEATAAFGEALDRDPSLLSYRLYRAHGFYITGAYDSTIAELTTLVDSLRARDVDQLAHAYESKAMFEYLMGRAHERREDFAAARAAYGRALTEDLSFAMAHARLARLARAQGYEGDALAEYELAVGLRAGDAALRYEFGNALHAARRYEEAEAQLREAVRLEPHWATARYLLAGTLEARGKRSEAIAEYEAHIARCPRRAESQALEARRRIAALREAGGP